MTPTTATPDTRALARFLVAITTCTVALLLALVVLVGVSSPGIATPPPAAARTAGG